MKTRAGVERTQVLATSHCCFALCSLSRKIAVRLPLRSETGVTHIAPLTEVPHFLESVKDDSGEPVDLRGLDGNGAMSCRVLVIPEDPTFNGYLLKPLVARLSGGRTEGAGARFAQSEGGRFRAGLGGNRERKAARPLRILRPVAFSSDGDKAKNLGNLEAVVKGQNAQLIASYLTPEVEVTLIAGHPKANTKGWQKTKRHPRFKEAIFEPFLSAHGNPAAPGQGRERLMCRSSAKLPANEATRAELARSNRALPRS